MNRLLRTAAFRFAALYVVVFGLSLAALGCFAYFTVRSAIEHRLDDNIAVEASSLAAAYHAGGLDQLRSVMADQDRVASWQFRYRVMSPGGKTVVGALSIENKSIGWSKHEPDAAQPSHVALKALTVALGDQHRLSIASSTAALRDIEHALLQTFGGVLAAALLLGVGGGLLISSRFLSRIDRITSTAQSIMNGDLNQRIPLQSTNDDLDRLAGTLNAMLDRINELMESLRQVSNDIAHDLRTPLSRMQQKLELAVLSDLPKERLREHMRTAISETHDILGTFSALLRIAQIEAGTRKSAFAKFNFSQLLTSVSEDYAPVIEDNSKTLMVRIAPNLEIVGDRELLTQLVVNLLENSMHHAPADTHIELSLASKENTVVLSVSDDGPGVPASEFDRLFDRFYRTDRSRSGTGNGLGLSLVRAVSDLHNGTIKLRDNKPGLVVELCLPISPQ